MPAKHASRARPPTLKERRSARPVAVKPRAATQTAERSARVAAAQPLRTVTAIHRRTRAVSLTTPVRPREAAVAAATRKSPVARSGQTISPMVQRAPSSAARGSRARCADTLRAVLAIPVCSFAVSAMMAAATLRVARCTMAPRAKEADPMIRAELAHAHRTPRPAARLVLPAVRDRRAAIRRTKRPVPSVQRVAADTAERRPAAILRLAAFDLAVIAAPKRRNAGTRTGGLGGRGTRGFGGALCGLPVFIGAGGFSSAARFSAISLRILARAAAASPSSGT